MPRRVEIQYAAGVPKSEDREHRDRDRLGRDAERVLRRVRAERRDQVARRHLQEHRDDREEQEEEDDARGQNERRPEERVACYALGGSGRNPYSLRAA